MTLHRNNGDANQSPRSLESDRRGSPIPRLRPESKKVLVVEDERRLREMLMISIREMGLEPTGAASAEVALRTLDQSSFAIVMVDLNLPGLGGLELCEVIRERWGATQLIILTGFGDLETARRAIRLDVADFLTKPCGMDELESALARAQKRWLERSAESPAEASKPAIPPSRSSEPSPPAGPVISLDEMERQLILAALARHRGSREAAAADLGISVRKLYYRLQQYQK